MLIGQGKLPWQRKFIRNLYKNLVDEWTIIYNGTDKLLSAATGERTKFSVLDENLFELFLREIEG